MNTKVKVKTLDPIKNQTLLQASRKGVKVAMVRAGGGFYEHLETKPKPNLFYYMIGGKPLNGLVIVKQGNDTLLLKYSRGVYKNGAGVRYAGVKFVGNVILKARYESVEAVEGKWRY